jgi:hypothetical protein
MKQIREIVNALLGLARLVKTNQNEKAKIEKETRRIAELLKGAGPRDILNILDEIVFQGFSSSSDTMEPDGKGGVTWAPERSRIYCDCFFRVADVLKYTVLAPEKDLFGKITGRGMNISVLISFCRWLNVATPLPNLLSFEGRNKTAKLLRPKMPELTEYILSLNNQAKELDRQNRYEEAQKARDNAKKVNEVYGKMEQYVLPWLEKEEKKKPAEKDSLILGKVLETKGSTESVAKLIKDVLRETSK